MRPLFPDSCSCLGRSRDKPEVPEGCKAGASCGGLGTNYRGGMWVVQLLSVAYTEKLPNCVVGTGQEPGTTKIRGEGDL